MTAPSTTLWSRYLQRFGSGKTQAQVAQLAGVNQSTAGRWLNGKTVPDEAGVVAALARSLGRSVLEAFVAAGMLTEEEAGEGLSPESAQMLRELVADMESRRAMYHAVVAAERELREREDRGEILPPGAFDEAIARLHRPQLVVDSAAEVLTPPAGTRPTESTRPRRRRSGAPRR